MRAMAKKIEDRYGTMGELATALGDYLRQEESRSGPVTRLAPSLARSATQETVPGGPVAWEGHPPKVPPRRWRWAVAGALVGAVALLLSGIVIRYRDKDGKEKAIHIKDVGPGSEITVKTDGGRLVAGGSVPDEKELERPAVGQVKNPAKAPLPEKPSAAQGVAGKSPPTKEKPPLEEQRAAEVATPLTEVGPRDADSPVALKPFAPVKATLGRDQSTYLSASLPAGEYQVVLDTSRADGWCSNLQSRLSVVDEDGQVQDHNWISFNEIDFGFRHTRGFTLKAPATVRFRLSSTNDPSYFWLTLVKMPGDKRARLTDSDLTEADLRRYDPRKADLMPFPFYGKILPRLLKVGQAAKGTLEGGVDGSPYYIALLPKGEYKAILDLATADGGSTNIQAYLALLGADGGGQRSLCTVNDIDASSRAVGRFTLPRPAVVLFRLGNSSSGTVYRYALTVRPAAGG